MRSKWIKIETLVFNSHLLILYSRTGVKASHKNLEEERSLPSGDHLQKQSPKPDKPDLCYTNSDLLAILVTNPEARRLDCIDTFLIPHSVQSFQSKQYSSLASFMSISHPRKLFMGFKQLETSPFISVQPLPSVGRFYQNQQVFFWSIASFWDSSSMNLEFSWTDKSSLHF